MKRNRIISLCIAFVFVMSIFSGTTIVSQAAPSPIGNELLKMKDTTFDTLTPGAVLGSGGTFGSALATSFITAGGANGTANYYNVAAGGGYTTLGLQEATSKLLEYKSYRYSFWHKGAQPFVMKLYVYANATYVAFDVNTIITAGNTAD